MAILVDDRRRIKLMCDLQSEYGVDLDDFFRGNGKLPLVKLLAYIKELPQDSRLVREFIGDSAILDRKEHLLLDIIDLLRIHEWQMYYLLAANRVKAQYLKKPPKRIPRPGDPKPKFITGKELAQKWGGMENRRK